MALKRVDHVGIMVSDLEASIAFYRDVVGLSPIGTMNHPNGVLTLAFLGVPGDAETQVELIHGYHVDPPPEGRVHHLAFAVEDLDAEIERLKGHRATFVREEITTLPNGCRYIFFRGPDGERIEFFERPQTPS